MVDIIVTRTTPTRRRLSMVVLAAPFRYLIGVARRIHNRRDMNRLLGMPDRILKDVGLQRDQIQNEATRPLWHD